MHRTRESHKSNNDSNNKKRNNAISQRLTKQKKSANQSNDTKKENETSHLGNQATDIIHRMFKRLFFLALMLVAVYWFAMKYRKDPYLIFVKSGDFVQRRAYEVPCSQDYERDETHWKDCIPKRCGRVVMDDLISTEDADKMLSIARKGLELGGSNGGASILDLHSGALSRGDSFVNIFSLPEAKTLFTEDDFSVFSKVRNQIQIRIGMEFGATPDKLYLTHPTFFSRMTAKLARTIHDEYWHPHIDKETYETFHYTSLLYLGTYEKNFSGGRFVFVDNDANRTVEPRKGRVSMFTSGSENLHFVEKVTSGERYAVTISFTCNRKSAIQDPAPR